MVVLLDKHESPTVLLIDDDMVTREVMATMLTMSGYPVHTADSGDSALALLATDDCRPDVILMDAQMPGLSGLPLIKELRDRFIGRLYVISASSTPQSVLDASDGFILKPFPPETLTRLIEEHEAKKRPPVPPGLDPSEAVINPITIKQLREMMPASAIGQIFHAIIADLGRRVAKLETAIAESNWTEARSIGHAIKGGAAMAGATQISRLGGLIESGVLEPGSKVNQVNNSATIIQDLRNAALNLQAILDAEFKP